MIDVIDIHKRYGATEVLRGVSLSVRRGEVCALLGPSGGGKSTLLRTINGLESFDRGRIRVDDLELTGAGQQDPIIAQIRRRVGMVFQQFNLFPHRSVLDNVTEAPRHVLRDEPGTGGERGQATAVPRRSGRQTARATQHLVRRPAAAGGDRPSAGHETRGHPVR